MSEVEPVIVVIGASAGGVHALRYIASRLDPRVPAIWCMAIHIDAHGSTLPALLEATGPLPASHALDGEELRQGHIFVAPPDLHLLVQPNRLILSHGPRVNWTRPAIDPLFESAAAAYGPKVLAAVLTGELNDGTAGLMEVKRRGGTAVVQDPRDARWPGMPTSALAHVEVDHCVPLADMPSLLCQQASAMAERRQSIQV